MMKETQLHFFNSENGRKLSRERHLLTLPLDTLVMFAVVVVLLFVLTFSLGVERGRRIAYRNQNLIPAGADSIMKASNEVELKNTEQASVKAESQTIEIKTNNQKDAQIIEEQNKKNVDEPKYIIQVASYLEEGAAKKEALRLENNGYPVLLDRKGKYVVIFVGEFTNKDEATKNMQSLKNKFKDCFIRRVKI